MDQPQLPKVRPTLFTRSPRRCGLRWYVVDSHDQMRGRRNCVAPLLSLIPYAEVPREAIKLPKRQPEGDYIEPDYPFRRIPEKY
jgi:polyphosphate kinase